MAYKSALSDNKQTELSYKDTNLPNDTKEEIIVVDMVTSALGYTPPRVIVQSSEPAISTNDEWLLEY